MIRSVLYCNHIQRSIEEKMGLFIIKNTKKTLKHFAVRTVQLASILLREMVEVPPFKFRTVLLYMLWEAIVHWQR